MKKTYKFESEDIQKIKLEDYSDYEFSIARVGFLSTRPNTHKLEISEEVLRESAPSVLGKWMVCDIKFGDALTHTNSEVIVGRIPESQDVEFVYDDDGYLRAYVEAVISKIYAKDYCHLFEDKDNKRSVSVEMQCNMDEENENRVLEFNIVGVTTLGRAYNPSCPESDVTMIRFSEQDADSYFAKIHKDRLTDLENFAKEDKEMTYKIDKSKEAMSDADWSDVDKTALRNKIMVASNRDKLVKAVYALVLDGWEEAPSEKLKYPLMMLEGDTFIYNRNALASALSYAKKENEATVVSKIEKIYKDLGLEEKERKEETKMEIEFAAVNIGDLWSTLYNAMRDARHWDYYIQGIYEEDNQKFAIIYDDTKKLYRLDFSLTEEGITLANEVTEVVQEFVVTDNIQRFAEPENVADYQFAEPETKEDEPEKPVESTKDEEEKSVEMSVDECMEKIAKLEADVEERDNIIMTKDTELEELRAFKKGVEDKEKAVSIETVLSEIKGCIDEVKMAELRSEGMTYEFANLDVWSNKVKAMAFEATKPVDENNDGIFRCAAPVAEQKKSTNVWERIKNSI